MHTITITIDGREYRITRDGLEFRDGDDVWSGYSDDELDEPTSFMVVAFDLLEMVAARFG